MTDPTDPFDLDHWCSLDLAGHRELLARTIRERLGDLNFIRDAAISVGPRGREYDLTAIIETDVGRLRSPVWSHARSQIYCDPSIHPANRRQVGPAAALDETLADFRVRLNVPFRLESRGLTFDLPLEEGVTRNWTAEHSRFRKRTAVTRQDVVNEGADVDVRDLLAHFYIGPSLRLVGEDGEAFLLPAASDAEGRMLTLCSACQQWTEGDHLQCPYCQSENVERINATRHPRRLR